MDKRRLKISSATLIIAFGSLLTGCNKKELDKFEKATFPFTQEITLPLFSGTITIKDSIPFYFPKFTLSDTLIVELRPSNSPTNTFENFLGNQATTIDFVELKLNIVNNFPSSGRLQLYFLDANLNVLDSLFSHTPMAIPFEESPTETTIFITMNASRYEKITRAANLTVFFSLSAMNFPPTTSSLSLSAGIKIKLKRSEN